MKVLACVLLCVVAAVQGRSTGADTSRGTLAAPGSNPWLVHLRLATSTSGLLRTCAGSLIDPSWVLTSAECTRNCRFAWLRYGTTTVINPPLVTESSTVRVHPQYNPNTNRYNLALININRVIQSNDLMGPVPLSTNSRNQPANGTFCGFGAEENGAPGEQLSCHPVELQWTDDQITAVGAPRYATEHDSGAPLVVGGVQVGILNQPSDNGWTTFTRIEEHISWINTETGRDF